MQARYYVIPMNTFIHQSMVDKRQREYLQQTLNATYLWWKAIQLDDEISAVT